jgi:L-aminopeptidase/D-esterase-like protein
MNQIEHNMTENTITDVPGIKVGHAQNFDSITGCTVILCKEDAVAGVDQRGGAPGTRETDLLNPVNQIDRVSAILLTGGSAFGLDAASGVMNYLSEKNIGYQVGPFVVPIVPTAVLFDLFIGDGNVRPNAEMGYQACTNTNTSPLLQGSVGAGTGATLGKLKGMDFAVKGGIGSVAIEVLPDIWVGAIVAVNPIGDVLNPTSGKIIAGVRTNKNFPTANKNDLFSNSINVLQTLSNQSEIASSNTVIGAIATNAKLTKTQATRVAQMAQNGVVRTIRPANTMFDGDTMFCLSTGEKHADVNLIGAFAAQMVEQSIINAIKMATSMGGIPSISDL